MGQPSLRFRRPTTGSSSTCEDGVTSLFAEPQGVPLLEEVTKLNTLVLNVWLSRVEGSLGKGKDRPFDESFDYLLELANHGVFHANQVSFIVVTLSPLFQTNSVINVKTQILKNGFADGFPSHNTAGSFVFSNVKH